MLKYFKKPSLLMLFISSLLALTAVESNAHIQCPVRDPIFGTTNDRCPHPPHKNPLTGLSEEVWGEAGRVAYQTAAATMAKRSPTGEPLDASLKNSLRPHFDGLVDRVTIHWGTPGLDQWSANQIGINLSGTESAGQTYGHDIYLDQQKPNNYSQGLIKLIIHEMVHSEQYERYSSELSNFGYHYFKKYKQAGQNYDNNELEREAKAKADRIYQQVDAALNRNLATNVTLPDTYLKTPVLDPDFYLLTYGDLRKVYGQTNPDGARRHWTLHGLKEGRRSSPAFDVRYYRNIHSDLTRIFGDDFYGVVDHWLRHGITEGRRSSLVFDVKHYLGKYPDLQQAFGATNYSAAVDHWLRHGVQEGRQGSPDFDPKFYLSNNPDVARMYGENNYMGAIAHYLEFGKKEGRKATP